MTRGTLRTCGAIGVMATCPKRVWLPRTEATHPTPLVGDCPAPASLKSQPREARLDRVRKSFIDTQHQRGGSALAQSACRRCRQSARPHHAVAELAPTPHAVAELPPTSGNLDDVSPRPRGIEAPAELAPTRSAVAELTSTRQHSRTQAWPPHSAASCPGHTILWSVKT